MNGNIKKIKDPSGNGIYPITRAEAVFVEDNKTLKQKLAEVGEGGGYTLPTASSTVLGGVKIGSGLSINNGVLSASGGGQGGSDFYNSRGYSSGGLIKDMTQAGIYYVSNKGDFPVELTNLTAFRILKIDYAAQSTTYYWTYQLYSFDLSDCFFGFRSGTSDTILWRKLAFMENNFSSHGKKVAIYGDSITQSSGIYAPAKKASQTDLINCGVGGTSYSKRGDNGQFDNRCIYERTKPDYAVPEGSTDITKLDCAVLFGGTNDQPKNGIGTVDSTDEFTLGGALNGTITNIISQNPKCKILVCGIMYRTNTQEHMHQYNSLIKSISEKYNLPFLDLWKEGGVNSLNVDVLVPGGLHPDPNTGGIVIGTRIGKFIAQHV